MISVGIMCHATVGGSARTATHLAAELSGRGLDVTVFAPKLPAFRLPPEVEVRTVCDAPPDPRDQLAVTLDRATFDSLRGLVVDAVRAAKLDVLHFHYALPFAAVAREARNLMGNGSPRIVGTVHGTDVSLHGADEATHAGLLGDLGSADVLTTVSESHAALVRDRFSLDPIVIPNFVDLDVFGPTPPGRRPRPRVLHLSNFRPVKNTLGVARAFARLYASTDAELWLVGNGETLPATLGELQRGGVPKSAVRCFGMVEKPSQIVAQTDVLLLPSHSESFGLAALEAMACGVPVVGTRVGGLTELIDGQGCGVLVDPGDDSALAWGLKHALDRRAKWGQGAIRRAADYSVDTIVPCYERLYQEVLAPERSTVALASGQVGQ